MTDNMPTEPIKISNDINQLQQLQLILGAMPVGVIVVDKQLIIRAFNAKAEAIIDIDAEDAIGQPYDTIMQAQHDNITDPLKEAIETGKTFVNQRFYIKAGDENPKPIRHSATVIRDEEGNILNGVTIFADVSKQVLLERQLEGQRRYLRDVLRSIPDGVATTNSNFVIESWNYAAANITGLAPTEVIGKPCSEVLGEVPTKAIKTILEDGHTPILDEQTTLSLPDDKTMSVSFSANTIYSPDDDSTQGGIIVFRDISEQLSRNRELGRQRRYLSQVLEMAPYGIFTVGTDMRIQTFNRSAEKLTGFAASFAIGKPYQDIIKIEAETELDPISASMTTGGQSAAIRLKLRDAMGATLTVRYSASPLIGTDDQIEGSIVVFDDIGDIVAAERTKNEFFSMVSHELRTPLTSIKGFVTAVLDGRAGTINEKQTHFLRICRQQSDTLLQLINDLLDLSRLESGRVELDTNRIEVEKLATRAAEAITPLATPKALTVELAVMPDLPHLWADENKLFQVLQNLLSNAVKFTPKEGTVTLQAEMTDQETFCFSVTDTGHGIPLAEQKRIFEPFYQVENIHTRQVGGTGLGLPIVKTIIEEHHGGRVELESEEGVGTTFRIYLPRTRQKSSTAWSQTGLTTPAPPPVEKTPSREAPKRLNPLVLVVDDDPSVGMLIQFTLEQEGYTVIAAAGGAEAIDLAVKKQPDLITLDVLMPEMDGFHVLDMLKKTPATAQIPVCMVSIVEDKVRGYQLGAIEYVSKPFEREQLLAAVGNILDPLSEGETAQILVVEDDPNIIELVEMTLDDSRYEVIVANDGVQGLEQLRRSHPTLVLLDIMIPKIDGYEFIRQAKADSRTADVPIIVLSVRTLEEDITRALRLGAEKYLTKSANIEEKLSETIQQVVRKALDDE